MHFYFIDTRKMENKIRNEKVTDIFVIIAQTLDNWQSAGTVEGNAVLMEHHKWAAELKDKKKLLLAGPTDWDLTSTNKVNPIGHTTGIIMLNVDTREEAIEWAEKDPFHKHGYRINVVHSMKITMTENSGLEALS
jgi:uncharacterized protein YciI